MVGIDDDIFRDQQHGTVSRMAVRDISLLPLSLAATGVKNTS